MKTRQRSRMRRLKTEVIRALLCVCGGVLTFAAPVSLAQSADEEAVENYDQSLEADEVAVEELVTELRAPAIERQEARERALADSDAERISPAELIRLISQGRYIEDESADDAP
jgi:hypothetical protein